MLNSSNVRPIIPVIDPKAAAEMMAEIALQERAIIQKTELTEFSPQNPKWPIGYPIGSDQASPETAVLQEPYPNRTKSYPIGQEQVLQKTLTSLGGKPMKKVSKRYTVTMKALINGKETPVEVIDDLDSSNSEAVLPALSPDGKEALIRCQEVAQGVTLTGKAIVMVNGKGKLLSATSAPFDVVPDDGLEVKLNDEGDPVLDPATGQPQQVPTPMLGIVVAENAA